MRTHKSPGSDTSQSLEDKLTAFKYFIYGKGIPYAVLKATTSELIGPKKKHLNYLVNMTHEQNVSIPNMVKHLMLRARYPDWPVSFKAIITIHHLMVYGNERFIQNLASSTVNCRLFDRLNLYIDRTTNLGRSMSVFLRRYSRYLSQKIQTYRTQGVDYCRLCPNTTTTTTTTTNIESQNCTRLEIEEPRRRGTESRYYYSYDANKDSTDRPAAYYVCPDEGSELSQNPSQQLKNMPIEQLLKIIPIIQVQFDLLLAFNATEHDLTNGIIISAFNSLYRDFLKLYIAYQVAIIRLLELYFSSQLVRRVREMLELYKKFLIRMFDVRTYLSVVDSIGLDKSQLPLLNRTPSLPLPVLENHLESLEARKRQLETSDHKTGLRSTASNSSSSRQLNRVQSVDLPRIEYGTLGRPRKRSLRTPTLCSLGHQRASIELMSPLSGSNFKQRQEEELKRLDRMLNMTTTGSGTPIAGQGGERGEAVRISSEKVGTGRVEEDKQAASLASLGLNKRKRINHFNSFGAPLREDQEEEAGECSHRYEELVDSLLQDLDKPSELDEDKSQSAAAPVVETKDENTSDWLLLDSVEQEFGQPKETAHKQVESNIFDLVILPNNFVKQSPSSTTSAALLAISSDTLGEPPRQRDSPLLLND